MMVQLPLKFPTEFYIAHATSNMNKYYAPLPRPSTDHKSCKTPRSFDSSPVLSSSPVRNNNSSNAKKPWFRPYCLFPRILIHKVRTSESGPSSSSSSSSKYRLIACFYKKNIPPCRGSGSAPYMKPADLAVTISEAKSDCSFDSTDSCLGELQPILTNVISTDDHESRWDYLEDPSEEMLDDIDRKIAGLGICMDQESNIGMNISSSNGGKVENNRDTANRIRNIGGVDNSHIDRSSSMNELPKGVGDDHKYSINLSNEEAGIHIENNNNNNSMDTEEETNIAGDGKFKYDEIKLVDVMNMDQETFNECSNGEFAQDVTQLSVIVGGVNISNWEVSNEAGVVINRETSEDALIKGEMENADNIDMEKSSDGEFEIDIFKPSIMDMDSSMNIKKGEIALGGRVSNEQLEEQPLEINREIERAMEEENSRISYEEYFELDLSSPSKLHGNINVPENNMMVQKDDSKSNILMDQMKVYKSLDSIKKHDAEVSSSANLGRHSRRLFVAKKLKDSAKRRLLVLFNRPYKHKTKKKVIVLTTTDEEGSETYFWSKPILRGKRCRELPVEEFLYTAGACGGGAVAEATMEAAGDRFTFS